MPDGATSNHPAVQAQLDRLSMLSPGRDVLGMSRISALLDALDNPHKRLPPSFHVAGTNGKGSTCTFLRAMLEARGYRVHVFTSPHLVRYNERMRIAGTLIDDSYLASLLSEVLDASGSIQPSFFEVTTAVAMLAFARVPADACIFEVGLGGRLDATNVLEQPIACGIAGLAIDHKEFLLTPEKGVPADPLARIAFEKAGIAKRHTPLVTQTYTPQMEEAISCVAAKVGAQWLKRDRNWFSEKTGKAILYRDEAGELTLPPPSLEGSHQSDNATLAVAMLRYQNALHIDLKSLASGIQSATWPARLQKLAAGPLTALVPRAETWLDGGHNPHAAKEVRRFLMDRGAATLILGLLANKDLDGYLKELQDLPIDIVAVTVPDHPSHTPEAIFQSATSLGFTARTATNVQDALETSFNTKTILIAGSLYLAGEVLRLNQQLPL